MCRWFVVHVGYEYVDCNTVFWQTLSTTIPAYDISSSDIGGWNFHVHHTYNFQQGMSTGVSSDTAVLTNQCSVFAIILHILTSLTVTVKWRRFFTSRDVVLGTG